MLLNASASGEPVRRGRGMDWDLTAEQRAALKVRLARSIDSSAGSDKCWPWTGGLNREGGYGRSFLMRDGKQVGINASRAAFLAEHGSLRADEFVLHSCDFPACCNPQHLRAGSHQENMDDRKRRGKYYSGADNYRALQISDELVAEIRARYAPRKPGRSQQALANQYGLSRGAVQAIIAGRGRWSNGDEPAPKPLIMKGHEMWGGGEIQTDAEGYVLCRCGARGPQGADRPEATEWHRQHKAELSSQAAA